MAGLKILVLDDNENVRRKLKRLLRADDRSVFEADTGESALALIEEHAFDVIFFDVMLPLGVSGLDVCRKAREIRPDLGGVIILTGWPDTAIEEEAKSLGATYLHKAPFDREQILSAFNQALSQRRTV
jgi:two-component system response regulator YesN